MLMWVEKIMGKNGGSHSSDAMPTRSPGGKCAIESIQEGRSPNGRKGRQRGGGEKSTKLLGVSEVPGYWKSACFLERLGRV